MFKFEKSALNDVTTFLELDFCHDQRRGKAYDIAVGRLCQQAVFGKLETKVHGRRTVFGVVDHYGIEQAFFCWDLFHVQALGTRHDVGRFDLLEKIYKMLQRKVLELHFNDSC